MAKISSKKANKEILVGYECCGKTFKSKVWWRKHNKLHRFSNVCIIFLSELLPHFFDHLSRDPTSNRELNRLWEHPKIVKIRQLEQK